MRRAIKSSLVAAYTSRDVIIIIAGVVICVGILFMLSARHKHGSHRITCFNQLRSLGVGFRLYASDGDPYPPYNPTNEAWQYFQAVGKEIGSPKVLLCPEDSARTEPALDFEVTGSVYSFAHPKFQNKALSYFYATGMSETNPGMILAGDRNLSTNEQILSGVLVLQTNSRVQWTKDIHKDRGNVVLADGSAQQVNNRHLSFVTNRTQHLVLP